MIAGRFATLVYLRLDAARGENPLRQRRSQSAAPGANQRRVEALRSSGTVLGVFPDAEYARRATALRSGDRLLLYTDGITEARNADGEEFGEERLSGVLVRNRHLSGAELHAAVTRVRRLRRPASKTTRRSWR